MVTEKLVEHFPKIMDVKFTSHMEDELDKIEDEKIVWLDVLKEFYEPFKNDLERAVGEMKSVKGTPEESTKICTVCGQPMVIRWGKHGKFLGCSAFPKCKSTLPLDEKGEPAAPETTDQKCEKMWQRYGGQSQPSWKISGMFCIPKLQKHKIPYRRNNQS